MPRRRADPCNPTSPPPGGAPSPPASGTSSAPSGSVPRPGSAARARRLPPLFQGRQLDLGLGVLRRVASQEAVAGPVGADLMLLTDRLHGRLLDGDALGLEEMVGQLLMGPVGPVQPLLGWSVDDPLAEGRGQLGGEPGLGPLGL